MVTLPAAQRVAESASTHLLGRQPLARHVHSQGCSRKRKCARCPGKFGPVERAAARQTSETAERLDEHPDSTIRLHDPSN